MKLSMLLHLREVRTRTLCNGFSYYFYLSTEAAVAPSNVTANGSSSTVILVEWEGLTQCRLVNGHIVGYRVQYGVQSGGLVLTKAVTGNWSSGRETDLTGLTPSTKYTIAVAAVNEEGTVGLYSDPITMETEAEFSDHISTLSQEYMSDDGQEDTAKPPEVAPIIIGAALTLFGVLMATYGIITGCVLCTRSVSH